MGHNRIVVISVLMIVISFIMIGAIVAMSHSTHTVASGWIAVIGASFIFGATGIPMKACGVEDSDKDPLIFSLYSTFGIIIVNFPVLVYLLATNQFRFLPWAVLGSLDIIVITYLAFIAVRETGYAKAPAMWCSVGMITSFMQGLLLFREPIHIVSYEIAAIALLIVGVVTVNFCQTEQQTLSQEQSSLEHWLPLSEWSSVSVDDLTSHDVSADTTVQSKRRSTVDTSIEISNIRRHAISSGARGGDQSRSMSPPSNSVMSLMSRNRNRIGGRTNQEWNLVAVTDDSLVDQGDRVGGDTIVTDSNSSHHPHYSLYPIDGPTNDSFDSSEHHFRTPVGAGHSRSGVVGASLEDMGPAMQQEPSDAEELSWNPLHSIELEDGRRTTDSASSTCQYELSTSTSSSSSSHINNSMIIHFDSDRDQVYDQTSKHSIALIPTNIIPSTIEILGISIPLYGVGVCVLMGVCDGSLMAPFKLSRVETIEDILCYLASFCVGSMIVAPIILLTYYLYIYKKELDDYYHNSHTSSMSYSAFEQSLAIMAKKLGASITLGTMMGILWASGNFMSVHATYYLGG